MVFKLVVKASITRNADGEAKAGHTELAIKGDNGPNESSIENTTYDLSKDDLNHILGCVGVCRSTGTGRGASAWAASGTIVLA